MTVLELRIPAESNSEDHAIAKLKQLCCVALEDEMERRGLNQSKFAELLEVDPSRVSRLVRGEMNKLGVEWLLRCCRRAGVPYTFVIELNSEAN